MDTPAPTTQIKWLNGVGLTFLGDLSVPELCEIPDANRAVPAAGGEVTAIGCDAQT